MISAACKKRVWKTVCLNGIFLLLCLLALMPILYALSVSFSGRGTVLSGSLSLFPQNPTFENYRAILFDEPFLLWMKNSLLLSAGTILLAMLCAIPAAYAASRWRYSFHTVIRTIMQVTMIAGLASGSTIFRII